MTVIITLLIICLVTIVHEFGHFIAARLNGVRVLEFSVGMGLKLWGHKSKKSGTLFSVKAFPIGGSCLMLGESEEDEAPDSFNKKPVWRRITIILAGVFMNVVLAVVISFFFLLFNYYSEPVAYSVDESMPAYAAGLRPNDKIVKINGKTMHTFDEVRMYLRLHSDGTPLEFTIERETDGAFERFEKTMTPVLVSYLDDNGKTASAYRIGIGSGAVAYGPFYNDTRYGRDMGFGEVIATSWYQTVEYVDSVVGGLFGMITGKFSVREAGGPIYMGKVISDTNTEILSSEYITNKGLVIFWTMLQFAAIISANLAVVNLFPIPALDGGRFIILVIEGIIRKPLNQNAVGLVTFVSFALLMILAAAVAFSDILKLFA